MKYLIAALFGLGIFVASAINAFGNDITKDVRWEMNKADKEAQYSYVEDTNYGGSITEFVTKYKLIKDSGGLVKVDGFCISACTIALSLLPSDRICSTERGLFGFHSAHYGTTGSFAKEATRLMWHFYPEHVRKYLRETFNWDGDGNEPHPDIMYVPGQKLVRAC